MPDAGSYYFDAISSVGEDIGNAIKDVHKRREQHRQMASMVDMFATMPRDPSAPPGTEGSKPLFDKKTHEKLMGYVNQNTSAADAVLAAYMGIGQKLAFEGAKARLATENIMPVYGTDPNTGQVIQIGERGSHGGLKPYPKWLVEPSGADGGNLIQKDLAKGLAKYGLEPADFTSVKELHYLDSEGNKIMPMKGKRPTLLQRIHLESRQKLDKKAAKEEIRQHPEEASFIQGKTSTGLTFKMPVKEFERLHQMSQKQAQTQKEHTTSRGIITVHTPADARKLPPGTVFRTPDGRILRTRGQSNPVTNQIESDDDNGE